MIEAQQNQGSIFDQAQSKIQSNIYSTTSDISALGYFSVSSVKTASTFIDSQDFPVLVQRPDSVKDACTKIENDKCSP